MIWLKFAVRALAMNSTIIKELKNLPQQIK